MITINIERALFIASKWTNLERHIRSMITTFETWLTVLTEASLSSLTLLTFQSYQMPCGILIPFNLPCCLRRCLASVTFRAPLSTTHIGPTDTSSASSALRWLRSKLASSWRVWHGLWWTTLHCLRNAGWTCLNTFSASQSSCSYQTLIISTINMCTTRRSSICSQDSWR